MHREHRMTWLPSRKALFLLPRKRGLLSILLLTTLITPVFGGTPISPSGSVGTTFKIRRDAGLEKLFRNRCGWIGGDAVDSVPLGNNRVLWIFGDTLVGRVQEGRRIIDAMPRNSIAIQNGIDPKRAKITFYHGSNGAQPMAFFRPTSGKGWLWPGLGGIRTSEGLYLFLSRVVNIPGSNGPWGFRTIGMLLVKITNPDSDPNQWIIRQYPVPYYSRDQRGNERRFGTPQAQKGSWIYLSGLDYDKKAGSRYLLAARTHSERLENFAAWEFRSHGTWIHDFRRAERLCDHVGAEISVSQLPGLNRHLLITTENGLSEKIVLRTSPSPWGPWSSATTLYHAPEPQKDRSILCYAAKGHPELSRCNDELIVSYICNATDPRKLIENPHLYFPEFLRVRFPHPAGSNRVLLP